MFTYVAIGVVVNFIDSIVSGYIREFGDLLDFTSPSGLAAVFITTLIIEIVEVMIWPINILCRIVDIVKK